MRPQEKETFDAFSCPSCGRTISPLTNRAAPISNTRDEGRPALVFCQCGEQLQIALRVVGQPQARNPFQGLLGDRMDGKRFR
jgi:hypothetical protein